MSAVAGIFCFDGAPVRRFSIERLTEAMGHRGPDARSHWSGDSIALGHCMLRVSPEACEERQPVISADKRIVMVWDGRIDNRVELRRAVQSLGAMPRDESDAELALQCYSAWNVECPRRILGDFSFAVWDAQRQHLFCASDHMGAKPFYYCHNRSFFAFASEDEALLSLPGMSARPRDDMVACYFVPAFDDLDPTASLLGDVSVLAPATTVTVARDGRLRARRYWQLEPGAFSSFSSDLECQEAFMDVFSEAVRCRLRGAGDAAAMMSGGLDSASLCATVKRLLPAMPDQAFQTYSAISDDPRVCIESQCILSLVEDFRDAAHFLSVPSFSGFGSVEDLVKIGWTGAHPVSNSILLPAMMCLGASRNGRRAILHGVSGDLTLYATNRYIVDSLRHGRWRSAWNESRNASLHHTYLRGRHPVRILSSNLATAFAPRAAKNLVRPLRSKLAGKPASMALLDPEFVRRRHMVDRMRAASAQAAGRSRDAQTEHIDRINSIYGIGSCLRACERIAGRFGIEPRDPWADRRVVEFFVKLPLGQKTRGGWTKQLVRRVFGPEWSPQVRERASREHLGWYFVDRLMAESGERVRRVVHDHSRLLSEYLDLKEVRARYLRYTQLARFDRLERERQYRLINELYRVVTLGLWLERLESSAEGA